MSQPMHPRRRPCRTGSALLSPVRGGQNGAEVRAWAVVDESVAQAELQRLAVNGVPMDGPARARWAACACACTRLPLADVDRLVVALSSAPASRIQTGATPVVNVSKVVGNAGAILDGGGAGAGGRRGADGRRCTIRAWPRGPSRSAMLIRCWTCRCPRMAAPRVRCGRGCISSLCRR